MDAWTGGFRRGSRLARDEVFMFAASMTCRIWSCVPHPAHEWRRRARLSLRLDVAKW